MREFAFELSLCAHLEATTEDVVSRQLGDGVDRVPNSVAAKLRDANLADTTPLEALQLLDELQRELEN
ncbi:hypothetical protein ACFQDG_09295 [Natronoarchaeum mannanilyticum]|uniref:hypothetical protein n=1 Tax=Natronoarchaeum mannanilyticum TaxID=926360 RepID=UPI00361AD143